MNTPIPPGFQIKYCEKGVAKGIEPNYCKPSGTAANGGRMAKDVAGMVFKAIEKKSKPEKKPEIKQPKPKPKKKTRKQILRERAEALFT